MYLYAYHGRQSHECSYIFLEHSPVCLFVHYLTQYHSMQVTTAALYLHVVPPPLHTLTPTIGSADTTVTTLANVCHSDKVSRILFVSTLN